jgi:FkbM family methyltransferase
MESLYNFKEGSGIFIQIGAGAGDLDSRANNRDGFTEFIKKLPKNRIKKIILVEPNPVNILLLRECWKDYPEVTIYELAIIPKNIIQNSIDFFYCPDDGPHFQVASINKQHIQKHYGNDAIIEKIVVNTKYIEYFINEITNEEVELLALDIEGIDGEIVLDLNFNNLKIKYLSFEYGHLGNNKNKVLSYLTNNNYKFIGNGVDHNGYDYLYIKNE